MVFMIRKLIQFAARKIANDPVLREKAERTACSAAKQAGKIVHDKDPARAAGRAVGKLLKKVRGE